jgi:hypothetical protein
MTTGVWNCMESGSGGVETRRERLGEGDSGGEGRGDEGGGSERCMGSSSLWTSTVSGRVASGGGGGGGGAVALLGCSGSFLGRGSPTRLGPLLKSTG